MTSDARAPATAAADGADWSALADTESFESFTQRWGEPTVAHFEHWAGQVPRKAYEDLIAAAAVVAKMNLWAERSGDGVCQAFALRAVANIAHLRSDYDRARDQFRAAAARFQEAGAAWELELGKTYSGLINPLSMMGEIAAARLEEKRARAIFERLNDRRALARLEIRMADLLIREDDFNATMAALDRAEAYLGDIVDDEARLSLYQARGLACQNEGLFDDAEREYGRLRELADARGLPGSAFYADYNVAYVYFLRGHHVKAIHMMDAARKRAEAVGDKQHMALCDYDQSDVCIELNLYEDALHYASAALAKFEALDMLYEAGKALNNMAVAENSAGRFGAALDLLKRAREYFERAGNEFWVHMTNLQRAVVLIKQKRSFEAVPLSARARAFFQTRQAPTKLVNAGIVEARARLASGDLIGATHVARETETALGDLPTPWLHVELQTLLGDLAERGGHGAAARRAYERAMDQAEATRGDILYEEMRISFMRNKAPLYENYLNVLLEQLPPPAPERVWEHMERAKSRSLAELMAASISGIRPREETGSQVVHEITRLRQELNVFYRQLSGSESAADLLPAIRERERQFLRALRQLPDNNYRMLERESLFTLEGVRRHLGDATLLEYFHCADGYVAAVADKKQIRMVRLPGQRAEVEGALRLLRFQVGKRAMESAHFQRFAHEFQAAARSHLELLHATLVAPLLRYVNTSHLLIVPHGVLHALPFAALESGGRALLEDYSVSIAPSAAVFALCSERKASGFDKLLLVAAEPAAAGDEVRAVSACWPGAEVLEGAASTLEAFRKGAESSRAIHVAAHGVFRADNPNFSALELADGRLNVIDIYNLRLQSELVVLSGCGTALGDLAGGDEVIGLTRAFLYAGARAVVASLWDVDDRTTAGFMTSFYQRLRTLSAVEALRQTELEFRQHYSHPFFWAPFQLIGSHSAPGGG